MPGDDIERLDEYIAFGNKLIQIIDKFKNEYSPFYSPHER